MKDIRTILPNIASDTTGAAAALFEAEGLTIIHDAAGSHEVFVTFEEARDLENRRTVSSRMTQLEAVTGDDSRLLDAIIAECEDEAPNFVAIIGSPVPFTIGADLDGLAAEVEFSTGVPAFAVNCGAFAPYDKGAGEAVLKLIKKAALPPSESEGMTVNLLGATPLDYSSAEIRGICARLQSKGVDKVNIIAMDAGFEVFQNAAQAKASLVISAVGLPAARWLKDRFGIPYFMGVPVSDMSADGIAGAIFGTAEHVPPPAVDEGKEVLIIGEAVLAKNLARNYMEIFGHPAVAGIVSSYDAEIFADVPHIILDTEDKIRRELKKGYYAVIGDPLYKLLLPKNSPGIFIERPHRAQSGRLYPPTEKTLDELIEELKATL